jgi:hypothetical protein
MITLSGYAQNLDDDSRTEVILSDGTPVVLYRAHSTEGSNIYYYLPVNMHLSVRDGRPEISFLLYDEDGNRGAILHFLLTWGLSVSQVKEANELLNLRLKDTVIVAGSVLVDAAPVSFVITGNDRLVKIMNGAISQNSQVPLIPGTKLAASFRFPGEEADYISNMIIQQRKTIDGAIRMIFTYKTMVKKGYVSKPVEDEWMIEMGLDNIFQYLRDNK